MTVQRRGIRRTFASLDAYLKTWQKATPERLGQPDHLSKYAESGPFFLAAAQEGLPPRSFNWVSCVGELRRCANDWALSAVESLVKGDSSWSESWQRFIAYARWGFQLDFQFHTEALSQFETGSRRQRLGMIPFGEAVFVMSNCWSLGWRDAGLQLFKWILKGLSQDFFIDAGTYGSRRAHYFCLRILNDFLEFDRTRAWPGFALDEPIYQELVAHWRSEDPLALEASVLAACDRHTHQSGPDTNKVFRDFNSYPQMHQPFEVLLLFRLRQSEGLALPVVDHPLLSSPLGKLHEEVPEYSDGLLRAVVARADLDRLKDS